MDYWYEENRKLKREKYGLMKTVEIYVQALAEERDNSSRLRDNCAMYKTKIDNLKKKLAKLTPQKL